MSLRYLYLLLLLRLDFFFLALLELDLRGDPGEGERDCDIGEPSIEGERLEERRGEGEKERERGLRGDRELLLSRNIGDLGEGERFFEAERERARLGEKLGDCERELADTLDLIF